MTLSNNKVNVINIDDITRLVIHSRTRKAIMIAKELGIEVLYTYKEQEVLNTICSSLDNIIPYNLQFSVGEYRIDLYIPSLKLAIECDERDHAGYSKDAELKREAYIKKKLGCEFIRFNPDDTNFNVGNVINKIFKKYAKANQ